MKTKHTPGPWMLQGEGTLLHPVTNRPLTLDRIETTLGFIEVLDETNEAGYNKHLIAAAPELLECLESFLRAPSNGSSGHGSVSIEVQEFNLRRAKEVIEKAKGNA